MTSCELQKQLFRLIASRIGEERKLVQIVSEILFTRRDASYRRIRGETPLTLQQLQTLCSHFQVSLDELLSLDNKAEQHIRFQSIYQEAMPSFEAYLMGLIDELEHLQSTQGTYLYVLSNNIPWIHFVAYPDLAYLKFIMRRFPFVRATSNDQRSRKKTDGMLQKIEAIYRSLPSVEFWKADDTPLQIEHALQHEIIGQSQATSLYQQLGEFYEKLEWMTEESHKSVFNQRPIAFRLSCFKDLDVEDKVLATGETHHQLYLVKPEMQIWKSQSGPLIEAAQIEVQQLRERSQDLSDQTSRTAFFQILRKLLEESN